MNRNSKELNDKIIYGNQVDVLLQEVFTQEEKLHVSRVLILLGVYRVLDSDLLFGFYKMIYKRDLKIRFIKLAAKHNLIVEFKNTEGIFFYELKKSGMYALEQAGKSYFKIGYFWTNIQRNGVFEYNLGLFENQINQIKRLRDATASESKEDIEKLNEEILNARYIPAKKDYFGYKTRATTFTDLDSEWTIKMYS